MITTLLIFLLNTGSTYAQQADKEEVVFVREYREYGWEKDGADGVNLPRPIQTLVGFYLVEYRLDAARLTITRLSASRPPIRTALFTTWLSRAQRHATQKMLSAANPDIMQQRCNANTAIVDDGFHLDVAMTKASVSKSFRWNGNDVTELAALLDVVNEASPKKYKFYQSGQKAALNKSLLHSTTDTP